MEEQKNQGCPEGCKCFMCQGRCMCRGWHGRGHFFLRVVLGLIILVAVFAVGVKVGELRKGVFGRGYGGRHGYYNMMPYGMSPYYYGQPYPGGSQYPQMMQRPGYGTSTSPVAPQQSATPK